MIMCYFEGLLTFLILYDFNVRMQITSQKIYTTVLAIDKRESAIHKKVIYSNR